MTWVLIGVVVVICGLLTFAGHVIRETRAAAEAYRILWEKEKDAYGVFWCRVADYLEGMQAEGTTLPPYWREIVRVSVAAKALEKKAFGESGKPDEPMGLKFWLGEE